MYVGCTADENTWNFQSHRHGCMYDVSMVDTDDWMDLGCALRHTKILSDRLLQSSILDQRQGLDHSGFFN